jgi:integrase
VFDLGVPVMAILGHSQIATTSDSYTHVMPPHCREVVEALDAWLDDESDAEAL